MCYLKLKLSFGVFFLIKKTLVRFVYIVHQIIKPAGNFINLYTRFMKI